MLGDGNELVAAVDQMILKVHRGRDNGSYRTEYTVRATGSAGVCSSANFGTCLMVARLKSLVRAG